MVNEENDEAKYYHCSDCLLSWPDDVEKYLRCPQCRKPTDHRAVRWGATVMTEREARSLVSHIKFEQYLENETDAHREKRARVQAMTTTEEPERPSNRAEFDAIVNHSWSKEDQARLKEEASLLPRAHKIDYQPPTDDDYQVS